MLSAHIYILLSLHGTTHYSFDNKQHMDWSSEDFTPIQSTDVRLW